MFVYRGGLGLVGGFVGAAWSFDKMKDNRSTFFFVFVCLFGFIGGFIAGIRIGCIYCYSSGS